jgi:DNA-binding transcriptional MerR regulator
VKILDIGELSKLSGVSTSALRYYEEIGLIQSIARHGLRRQFGQETITQLALISLGKTAGFSLDEIKSMFSKDGSLNLPRANFLGRAVELDTQIRRLTFLRDALRHVAECPADTHMECPKFKRLVYLAPHFRHEKR